MSSGLFCLFDYRKRILLRSKPVPFLDNWQKQTKGDKLHANLLSFIDFTEIPRYGDAGTVGNHLKSVKASPWIYPFMIFSLSLPLITPIIIFAFISSMIFTHTIVVVAAQKGVAPFPNNFPLLYGVLVLLIGGFIYKIVKALNTRNKLRLGYEGELVTAEELHKLMPAGNYVYHDFPAGNFNIDHIVVGPAGVFAIETKTRSKRISGNNAREAKAQYNGKEIIFPDCHDKSYLDQARRQAKWLSKWLTNATGEPVNVSPVVSIPGWFIEQTGKPEGVYVVNPRLLKSVIRSRTNPSINPRKIQQITHQLEGKCRDIAIKSKQYDK